MKKFLLFPLAIQLCGCNIYLHKNLADIRSAPESRISTVTTHSGLEVVKFQSPYGAYSAQCDCVVGNRYDSIVSIPCSDISSVETVRSNPWIVVLGGLGVAVGMIAVFFLLYPQRPAPGW